MFNYELSILVKAKCVSVCECGALKYRLVVQ